MSGELLGRYELVSLIGEGAMGTVYRAYDPHLERAVAIKVMSAALGNGPEAVARFKREAIALAALKHPQIVTIHDFLALSGNLCLVMELIEGEPLDRVIDQRQPLSVPQKLAFMASVCRALDYAHNHGIIHRDLKPSNILMLPDGTPKIVDFGIAKMANDDLTRKLTRTNARIGTIAYMSPEQFNGEPVDHRTDIFSAGIVLYELLSGISPFQGAHTSATMKKIILDPTPGLPPDIADVPDSVHGILIRALAKDASQRYRAASELADALAGYMVQPPPYKDAHPIPDTIHQPHGKTVLETRAIAVDSTASIGGPTANATRQIDVTNTQEIASHSSSEVTEPEADETELGETEVRALWHRAALSLSGILAFIALVLLSVYGDRVGWLKPTYDLIHTAPNLMIHEFALSLTLICTLFSDEIFEGDSGTFTRRLLLVGAATITTFTAQSLFLHERFSNTLHLPSYGFNTIELIYVSASVFAAMRWVPYRYKYGSACALAISFALPYMIWYWQLRWMTIIVPVCLLSVFDIFIADHEGKRWQSIGFSAFALYLANIFWWNGIWRYPALAASIALVVMVCVGYIFPARQRLAAFGLVAAVASFRIFQMVHHA